MKIAPETPAVVMTTKGVSLADKLKLSELPLATTPGGKNFAMKALHPSEHTIKTARVPGGNRNSVALCCDMVQTVDVPSANSEFDIYVAPSIMVPCSVSLRAPREPEVYANFYNAAFGGSYVVAPTQAASAAFMANINGRVTAYRITSQSVTAELIAPALSDQGTITAFQAQCAPLTSSPAYTTDRQHASLMRDIYVYPEPVVPSQGVLGTSAYTSKAREGVYMPLKLNSFKWKNLNDPAIIYSRTQGLMSAAITNVLANESVMFPYYEGRPELTDFNEAVPHPKLCGDNFGVIAIRGIAQNVSIRIRVRQVVEITAPPGTTYAPLLEVALPPDETAMRMYSEVSARMKDGYPSSYNDLGKLKDIIMGLGKKLLPYVEPALDMLSNSGIPVVSTGAQIGKAAFGAGKSIYNIVKNRKAQKRATGVPDSRVQALQSAQLDLLRKKIAENKK